MLSSFVMAVICILPPLAGLFPLRLISAGLYVANTLFHELGHAIIAWSFGKPAVPMIFTFIGADQAGGMSMELPLPKEYNWVLQLAILGYGCFWVKERFIKFFIPVTILSICLITIRLIGYDRIVISYMGHGGAIFIGGFFLFRSLIYLDARNQYERWLNGLFGFFLVLNNLYFSYNLVFDSEVREGYNNHLAFGVSENDFTFMAEVIHRWSVSGIATFTMGYCITTMIIAFIFAWYSCRKEPVDLIPHTSKDNISW